MLPDSWSGDTKKAQNNKNKRKDTLKENKQKPKTDENKANLVGGECWRTAGAVTLVFVLFSNSWMFAFQIRGAA